MYEEQQKEEANGGREQKYKKKNLVARVQINSYTTILGVIFRYFVFRIDLLLMIFLYIAGCNRIDVYHMSLLIIFSLYVIYPSMIRSNFLPFLYYIVIVSFIKYLYVLLAPEIKDSNELDDLFKVIGLYADYDLDSKYGRSNLFNNNYAIAFVASIQYRLYTATFISDIFNEEKQKADSYVLFLRHPKVSRWLVLFKNTFNAIIPWLSYFTFILMSILGSHTIMSWVILAMTLMLLYWHLNLNMASESSKTRLIRAWTVFILISAIFFISIVCYQITRIQEIKNTGWMNDIKDTIPDDIKLNSDIIGFEDLSDKKKLSLALHLFVYIIYFTLSVITRRHMIILFNLSQHNDLDIETNQKEVGILTEISERLASIKLNEVYMIYKLKKIWPVINIIAMNIFIALAFIVIILSVFWKVSIAMMIYLVILCYHFFVISYNIQPDLSKFQAYGFTINDSINYKTIKEIKEHENNFVNQRIHRQKQIATHLMIFLTIF